MAVDHTNNDDNNNNNTSSNDNIMTLDLPPAADDRAKNIAGLYSRLQAAVVDKAMNPEPKFIPLPPSLPISPSSSSPTPLRIQQRSISYKHLSTPRSSSSDDIHTLTQPSRPPQPQQQECPCDHILASPTSTQCSLCERTIPILEQLHSEKRSHEQEIKDLETRLKEEQVRIAGQRKEIDALQASVNEVESRLASKDEEFRALKSDMEMLNDKYVDEIERVAEIQHSKDMVESELEDLSRRLFEEANGMVANEKREKHNLEVAQKHLEKQLQETREQLAAEQMQLKELRLKMEEMADENSQPQQQHHHQHHTHHSSTMLDHPENGSDDVDPACAAQADPEQRAARDLAAFFPERASPGLVPHDWMDPMMLAEFEEFVKASPSMPLRKLHSLSFLKNIQNEDVDPCLRFGANPRLSPRKVGEAIVMNTCFIEDTPPGFAEEQSQRSADSPLRISSSKALIWERISNGGNPLNNAGACQACGRQDQPELPYRFRTSYFDDWACIDRYCRDRLVAVCEFYVFIRNVRQGYYDSRTVPDLYQEATRLRLQMFYARLGALPWTLRNLGVKSDAVGKATSPRIQVPPVVSESSPLPRTKQSDDGFSRAQKHTSSINLAVPGQQERSAGSPTTSSPSTSVSNSTSMVDVMSSAAAALS
ncbi:hypothetical protein BCR43DRAFT_486822 [Syncephalastrum racemosum]|uniref:GDP/GTP exchange factor Sec2 N-terminal domain-containing protein n=1 Tax=Syncephalastrum racemosum TaxID=13706 RepID=A0A1X2HPW5_SYNRA|nr:hypothetical protein BCR43DRAFT_486822 [Syncephalastrum racemosum]